MTSQGFEKKKERRIFYNVDKFDIIIDIRYELVLYNARDVLLLCSYKADETFVAECIPNLNIEYIYIYIHGTVFGRLILGAKINYKMFEAYLLS